MSFVQRVYQSRKGDIHLLRCQDIKGRECYYIIQCTKETLRMVLESPVDISDLSTKAIILAKGFGHEPRAATWGMLENTYGVKPEDFIEKDS